MTELWYALGGARRRSAKLIRATPIRAILMGATLIVATRNEQLMRAHVIWTNELRTLLHETVG